MTTVTRNQQIEFDVFPKDNKSNYAYLSGVKTDSVPAGPAVHVVFSYQSVIVIFICVLMSIVASFTLGVEKGKLVNRTAMILPKSPEVPLTPPAQTAAKPQEETKTVAQNAVPPQTQGAVTAAPAEPVATQEAKGSSEASGYVIQIASVKTESSAKNLVESLLKKGVPSFAKPSGSYIVVLAGNFAKKEEAQVRLKELKKTFNDCFIKKI